MADQKISQLTGATTPLAGTEVLPIVQSGVTKQVSVANLTAGRSTSVSELKVITANGQTNIIAGNTTGGNKIQAWNAAGNNDGYLGIEGFNIAYGQFTTAGNWAPANGLGIDFSATPGTGTSELLADYEEGDWTPSLGGNTTYFAQSGSYTKVGRMVFVRGVLVINAIGTGSTTQISGLPFANASGAVCAISVGSFFASATAVSSFFAAVSNGGSVINVGSLVVAGTTEGSSAIFGNNTQFQFSGCYSV